MNASTEEYLWSVVNGMGWYYWGPIAALGAWNLWGLYKLAAAASLRQRMFRISAYIGFMLVMLSVGNTAFGVLWPAFVLIGFRGMTKELYEIAVASGKIRPTKGTTAVRVASALVQK